MSSATKKQAVEDVTTALEGASRYDLDKKGRVWLEAYWAERESLLAEDDGAPALNQLERRIRSEGDCLDALAETAQRSSDADEATLSPPVLHAFESVMSPSETKYCNGASG